jgi:hypothetical protein
VKERHAFSQHRLPLWDLAFLKAFSQATYKDLGKARNATFELTDATVVTHNTYLLAELSRTNDPVFRRR